MTPKTDFANYKKTKSLSAWISRFVDLKTTGFPATLNLELKSGALLGESQERLPVEIQKSIGDDPT